MILLLSLPFVVPRFCLTLRQQSKEWQGMITMFMAYTYVDSYRSHLCDMMMMMTKPEYASAAIRGIRVSCKLVEYGS